jgi:hypothetical protein
VSFDIGDHLMASIRECVEELVSALTLSDGLIHTQFIYCGNRFYLIEITRRCPGDLYATLVDKSLNVEYAAFYSAPFCGENYPERNHARPRRFYSRHTVSTSRECVFLSCGLTLARAEISFVPLKRSGERLRPAPTDRAGIYFIKHFSASEMRQRTPRLREYVSIQAEACDV